LRVGIEAQMGRLYNRLNWSSNAKYLLKIGKKIGRVEDFEATPKLGQNRKLRTNDRRKQISKWGGEVIGCCIRERGRNIVS